MAPFGLGTRKGSLTSLRCGRSLMRESWACLRLRKRFVHILDKPTAELLVFVYYTRSTLNIMDLTADGVG